MIIASALNRTRREISICENRMGKTGNSFKASPRDNSAEIGELRLFCPVTAIQSLTTGISQISFLVIRKLKFNSLQVTPLLQCNSSNPEQVDLALVGNPTIYRQDWIYEDWWYSLSLIAPRVVCLVTQLLQEEPSTGNRCLYFAVRWNGTPAYWTMAACSKHIKHPNILPQWRG